jgi:hypothetical protein
LKHRRTEEAEDFYDSNFKTPFTPFLCFTGIELGAAQPPSAAVLQLFNSKWLLAAVAVAELWITSLYLLAVYCNAL